MADFPANNFFAEELVNYYNEQGKSVSKNIIEVLVKPLDDLNSSERMTYDNFVLPSLPLIRESLLDRLEKQESRIDIWETELGKHRNSIIGDIAAEVLSLVGLSTQHEASTAQGGAGEKTSYISCPECNEKIKASARFCENCGFQLLEKKSQQCANCGVVNQEGKNFCRGCGTRLTQGFQKPQPISAVGTQQPLSSYVPQTPFYQNPYAGTYRGSPKRPKNQKVVLAVSLSIIAALVIGVIIVAAATSGKEETSTSKDSGSESSTAKESNDRSSEAIRAAKTNSMWGMIESFTEIFGEPNIYAGERSGFTNVYIVQVEFPNGDTFEWIVDFREKPTKVTYRGQIY